MGIGSRPGRVLGWGIGLMLGWSFLDQLDTSEPPLLAQSRTLAQAAMETAWRSYSTSRTTSQPPLPSINGHKNQGGLRGIHCSTGGRGLEPPCPHAGFAPCLDVLEIVKKDSCKPTSNGGSFGLIGKIESFDFVFIIHLMIELFSITDNLSRALQRKDQDIVEAVHLIMDVKERLQDMRDNGWEPLFKRVKSFVIKMRLKCQIWIRK